MVKQTSEVFQVQYTDHQSDWTASLFDTPLADQSQKTPQAWQEGDV